MVSLGISDSDIPSLQGKTAIITGGSSGIGLAAVQLLTSRGATVHILDINPPSDGEALLHGAHFHSCNTAVWAELRGAFDSVSGPVDFAFANAGVSEEADYFADTFDDDGRLAEPTYRVLDVNVRGVYNFVKLALSRMRKEKTPGSIVITTSASGYAPEQSLPVYSSGKLAVSAHHSTPPPHTVPPHTVPPSPLITLPNKWGKNEMNNEGVRRFEGGGGGTVPTKT